MDQNKNKKPLVSILMNCYNGEAFIKESINSILNQTYSNWELVFWDNQSTDNSAKIFKSYEDKRFKYYYSDLHTHLGGGRARAFSNLKGELIAVLDTDDIWYPEKLSKQVGVFNDEDIGIVISNAHKFSDKIKKQYFNKFKPESGYVFEKLLNNYFVCLPTLMFRKSFAKKLNRQFDPEFNYISDFDLVLRLSKICKLQYIDEILAGWRLHGKNASLEKPFLFTDEKESWIKKLLRENKNIYNEFGHSINIFFNNLHRQKSMFSLMQGHRKQALKLIFKTKFKSLKDLVIFFAIILLPVNFIRKIYFKKLRKI